MHRIRKLNLIQAGLVGVLTMAIGTSYANNAVELVEGVIIDPEVGHIYLMAPEGAVEAINIEDGEKIWSNPDAGKPLAKRGNLIVAQADVVSMDPSSLELVVLDANSNGQTQVSNAIAMPPGVSAGIDEGLDGMFHSRAVAVGDQAFISWEYINYIPMQGALEEEEETTRGPGAAPPAQPAPKTSTIQFDLNSGKTTRVDVADLPPGAASAIATGAGNVTSPKGKLSADGRHTLRWDRVSNDSEWLKYHWNIVDNQTGDLIGEMKSYLSQSAFMVVNGNTIIYESSAYTLREESGLVSYPRAIRAFNLESEKELWVRELRETAYTGPSPP